MACERGATWPRGGQVTGVRSVTYYKGSIDKLPLGEDIERVACKTKPFSFYTLHTSCT